MDLSTLSLADLKKLQDDIPAEIKRREEGEKVRVLDELKKFAEARGFSLEQLLKSQGGAKGKVRAGKPVQVKYRHPENQELAWTGRGRKPQWVQAWLDAGKTMEQLAV